MDELMSLFEAARWAPSSSNNQPWRFLYARRDSEHWQTYFDLLTDGNKVWCKNAAVLVAIVSRKTFEHNGAPSRTYQFEAGLAAENLALEARSRGIVVHFMAGFYADKAREKLNVPDELDVLVMAAIGRPAPKHILPEALQAKEVPSNRKPLKEIVIEGTF